VKRQECCGGNGVADMRGFGIICDATLCMMPTSA
jgi:hypothetical protein